MTEPERIHDVGRYEGHEGADVRAGEMIAPRVMTKRLETRWEFGIFFRVFKNGRLVTDLRLGNAGRQPEARLLRRGASSADSDADGSVEDSGVDVLESPAPGGGDGGPIEETRTEVGFFVGRVTTETETGGSRD